MIKDYTKVYTAASQNVINTSLPKEFNLDYNSIAYLSDRIIMTHRLPITEPLDMLKIPGADAIYFHILDSTYFILIDGVSATTEKRIYKLYINFLSMAYEVERNGQKKLMFSVHSGLRDIIRLFNSTTGKLTYPAISINHWTTIADICNDCDLDPESTMYTPSYFTLEQVLNLLNITESRRTYSAISKLFSIEEG